MSLEDKVLEAVGVVSTDAVHAVLAERARQILMEGWTAEHDDEHSTGEIALAAACYALHRSPVMCDVREYWPLDPKGWKPQNQRRDLVRAAALLIAEIERLDRAGLPATQEGPSK
jgi:hypothetical protein